MVALTSLLKNLGQSGLSLSFTIGGLLAGMLLARYFGVFVFAPWTLILFPGILSMRGAIGGLFSARLSTGLHLGTIRASYTKNTKDFYLLLYTTITLALESSITMGLATTFFGIFLWRATILDSISILTVITATMGLSLVFISPITIAVSVLSFRHGLDPDIIVYPVTATIADIIITACYVFVLNTYYSLNPSGCYLIVLLDFVFLSFVIFFLPKIIREGEFEKIIKEFSFTLLSVVFIINCTGSVLHKLSEIIGSRLVIYMVYPALIDTVGGVGSIVGSTATTKLALGVVESSFSSIRQHLTEIFSAWTSSIMMFIIFSVVSSFAYEITAFNDILKFNLQLLTTNFLAIPMIVIIAYFVAILTYRRGLDPDNFVIPLESSLADSITTLSLLIALNILA